MDYSIDNIKQIDKGALRARFDVIVGPFIMKEFVLFEKNGEYWIDSPSRKYEVDGEQKYFSYIRCKNKETWDSFSNWAIDLVLDKIGKKKNEPITEPDDDFPF